MENRLEDENNYFGKTKLMIPVKFDSNNCKPGELANVQIISANGGVLYGIHKKDKMKAA